MPIATQFMYQQVRDALEDMIVSKEYPVGYKIPSDRELAKTLGCNYQTVRRGLTLLSDEGIVERRVGAGTFIRRVPEKSELGISTARSSHCSADIHSVGMICSMTEGDYPTEFIRHLHEVMERRGYRLTIRTVGDLGTSARDAARELLDQGCGGMLLPLFESQISASDVWEFIQSAKVPVVLGRLFPGLEQYCYEQPGVVGKPSFAAVDLACHYLKELGYPKIAFFGGNNRVAIDLQRRIMAYSDFIHREGMSAYIGLVGSDVEEVDRLVDRWAPMAGELGVVCWGDEFAIRLMTSLHKKNFRIPEDVGILGFGNHPIAEMADPPLSTICFDYEYVCNAMLDHLRALSEGRSAQADGAVRQLLVVRESCGGRARLGETLDETIRQVESACHANARG